MTPLGWMPTSEPLHACGSSVTQERVTAFSSWEETKGEPQGPQEALAAAGVYRSCCVWRTVAAGLNLESSSHWGLPEAEGDTLRRGLWRSGR